MRARRKRSAALGVFCCSALLPPGASQVSYWYEANSGRCDQPSNHSVLPGRYVESAAECDAAVAWLIANDPDGPKNSPTPGTWGPLGSLPAEAECSGVDKAQTDPTCCNALGATCFTAQPACYIWWPNRQLYFNRGDTNFLDCDADGICICATVPLPTPAPDTPAPPQPPPPPRQHSPPPPLPPPPAPPPPPPPTCAPCRAKDLCHEVGVCDPALGRCTEPRKADGAACDDGDAATFNDECVQGDCSGHVACFGVTCTASPHCHHSECNLATHQCEDNPLPDGNPCDDGDALTDNDRCASGICRGDLPPPPPPPPSPPPPAPSGTPTAAPTLSTPSVRPSAPPTSRSPPPRAVPSPAPAAPSAHPSAAPTPSPAMLSPPLPEWAESGPGAGAGAAVAATAAGAGVGGAAQAQQLALIAVMRCEAGDPPLPLSFHPTQWAPTGRPCVGAVIANPTIACAAAGVLFLLTVAVSRLPASALDKLLGGPPRTLLAVQGLLYFPSAPVVLAVLLYQGTALCSGVLLEHPRGVGDVCLGVVGLAVLIVFPFALARALRGGIPRLGRYRRDSEQGVREELHPRCRWLVGSGEWVSTTRAHRFVHRYTSVIRSLRPLQTYHGLSWVGRVLALNWAGADMVLSLVMALVTAALPTKDWACGVVHLSVAAVSLLACAAQIHLSPYAIPRDNWLNPARLLLQAAALTCSGCGYLAHSDALFTANQVLLIASLVAVFLKILADVGTSLWVLLQHRRRQLQIAEWGELPVSLTADDGRETGEDSDSYHALTSPRPSGGSPGRPAAQKWQRRKGSVTMPVGAAPPPLDPAAIASVHSRPSPRRRQSDSVEDRTDTVGPLTPSGTMSATQQSLDWHRMLTDISLGRAIESPEVLRRESQRDLRANDSIDTPDITRTRKARSPPPGAAGVSATMSSRGSPAEIALLQQSSRPRRQPSTRFTGFQFGRTASGVSDTAQTSPTAVPTAARRVSAPPASTPPARRGSGAPVPAARRPSAGPADAGAGAHRRGSGDSALPGSPDGRCRVSGADPSPPHSPTTPTAVARMISGPVSFEGPRRGSADSGCPTSPGSDVPGRVTTSPVLVSSANSASVGRTVRVAAASPLVPPRPGGGGVVVSVSTGKAQRSGTAAPVRRRSEAAGLTSPFPRHSTSSGVAPGSAQEGHAAGRGLRREGSLTVG